MAEDFEDIPLYTLTTYDNPFHPVKDEKQWKQFDDAHGYRTLERLGAICEAAGTSIYLSDKQNAFIQNRAIDNFLRLDFTNTYKKVLA